MGQSYVAEHDPKHAIWQVRSDNQLLLQYVYGSKEDPNPSFRLVQTLSGHQITLYQPWDHPWQLGLYFAWKFVNGLNFWEARYRGQNNKAVTDSFEPMADNGIWPSCTSADEECRIGFRQRLRHISWQNETLLHEERQMRVTPAEGGYVIHWEAAFTPQVDVLLDRTEISEKTPWGGYAGLACRLGRNYLRPVIMTDRGVFTAEEAHGMPAAWCDYAGKLDGFSEDKFAGICFMADPANLRHPAPMMTFDYKQMQLLVAAILYDEPLTLHRGEPLRLRYAVYVHDGQADPALLDAIYQREFPQLRRVTLRT